MNFDDDEVFEDYDEEDESEEDKNENQKTLINPNSSEEIKHYEANFLCIEKDQQNKDLDEFLIPSSHNYNYEMDSECGNEVKQPDENSNKKSIDPNHVMFFLEPLNIKTDIKCSVNHQKNPSEELYELALKLDAETKEKFNLKKQLDKCQSEIKNIFEPKIKKLEEEMMSLVQMKIENKRIFT